MLLRNGSSPAYPWRPDGVAAEVMPESAPGMHGGPRRMPRPAVLDDVERQIGATMSCATSHSVISREVSMDWPAASVVPLVARTT